MVPASIKFIFAVRSVAADPKLTVEERVFLLAVHLLAVVTKEALLVLQGAVFAKEELLRTSFDGSVGQVAQLVERLSSDSVAGGWDGVTQQEGLLEHV